MKQFKNNYLLILLFATALLASCHKNNDNPPVDTTPVSTGLFVLNQGGFNGNNSTLSVYDYTTKTVTADKFSAVNSRGLGDTGNDIETYGSKTYIVVNVSSNVEVINTKTGKSIAKIPFFTGTSPRQPRDIVFYKGNAFVSAYDGTVAIIDTATLTITNINKPIIVGSSPEQMAISNGKLYVANSGGLNYPNFSSTVSVIDLSTLTVTKTLTVGTNPQGVAADAYGLVYVQANGDYGSTKASLTVIDATTDVIKSKTDFDGSNMAIQGDNLYFTTSDKKIKVYNVKSQAVTNAGFVTDGTAIKIPYAVTADGSTGEVFVADAIDYSSNGTVFAFDKTGKLEYSIKVGINPGKILVIKN